MSVAGVACLPSTRSGATYIAVANSWGVSASSCGVRAMPKSATFAWSLASKRMFDGLRSAWMMPLLCANASPFAISTANETASTGAIGPERSRRCLSDPPGRCSMTMNGRPSTSPTS